MNLIKNFSSHLLAFIFFISLLIFSGTSAIKDLITHDNIYYALENTNYLEEIKFNENIDTEMSKELLEYIEIKDIIDHYIADKVLYEFNIIEKDPKINIDELNKRIALGIEKYIDAKLDEYSGGLNSILQDNGFDLGIKDKIEEYIDNNTSIDLSNNKIVTEKDLEVVYQEVDKKFEEVKEDTYIKEIIDIVYNDTLLVISLVCIIVTFILISLINFNILTGILYIIAPLAVNTLIFLVGYYGLKELKFTGGIEAAPLNYLVKEASDISFLYLLLFILLTTAAGFLYYIGKHINILISHKTGKTTLDTIFDDYDSEEVVRELQEKERQEQEENKTEEIDEEPTEEKE